MKGTANPFFYSKLALVIKDKVTYTTWGLKNVAVQEIYSNYLSLLPENVSPTLLFYEVPDYLVENIAPSQLPITKDIFVSAYHTRDTIIACILKSPFQIRKNISETEAVSPVIRKIALESLRELL